MMTAKDTSDHTSQATTFPVFQQKKSLPDNDDDRLDDISNASNEAQLEELNKEIVRELGPAHPIGYTHTIYVT